MQRTIGPQTQTPFSLRQLSPRGWYANQLRIQAEGLSGHLDHFWPDIKDSQWIGGTAEGWERMPYWLDGFIPLVFLRGDEDGKARAKRYIDAILARQQEDGWLCPTKTQQERHTYDVWGLFLILKVLVVWEDATGDPRIEKAVYRALECLDKHIDYTTLFDWAATRWYECRVAIDWLYARRPEQWLCNLAEKLRAQGFDWCGFFQGDWPMREPNPQGRWSQMNHVVNNAMMLKSPAMLARTQGPEALDAAHRMVSQLDAHHGSVTGVFTGDECLAGLNPSQGTELCAVAEYMYSLQYLIAAERDASWGDRLERIAFNAWPATFDPTMWSHQYVQQVNQMQATIEEDRIYRTNKADANTFGLEPDFGCCTANLSQGWPKLIQSVFYQAQDGVSVNTYLPCALDATHQGQPLSIQIDTEYPFRDLVRITVQSGGEVPLLLRIPQWAKGATAQVGEERYPCTPGQYLRIARVWRGEAVILHLPMEVEVAQRPNGLVSILRGPLVYALRLGEQWTQYNTYKPGHELPHGDFEIRPTTPWNMGVCASEGLRDIVFTEHPVGDCPFSPQGAPVSAQVPVRQVEWPVLRGCASHNPGRAPIAPVETATFIPYGCTNLRMTELPVVPRT